MEYPNYISRLFWEYDISLLNHKLHKNLIIERVLEKGNFDAISWLFKNYSFSDICESLSSPNISSPTRFLWQNYFAKITQA
ncbi:MAG: hypothetical protein KatS3mg085_105 [Candidatus Dojkabacteria bacterium]|nr:MAG: hypothetical protein KatS3mg085_105 [Candidatus Dojkabacteria bacterium]